MPRLRLANFFSDQKTYKATPRGADGEIHPAGLAPGRVTGRMPFMPRAVMVFPLDTELIRVRYLKLDMSENICIYMSATRI